eukprot:Gregarina_sp_Pseudo_9__217@NODE_1140_length_1846_cov_125_091312_g1067_i0_p1_GENE_NODE_1140_length_1846_cov_125_091312_g1067_i0NODE_1140_length_1846_cov_125_091312_g1067_i0_p1_ORF_typecomplete_len187_score54_28Med26_M/PF15694_5/5_4_NODE_1140_length_1846_cov_125_091312_g1067_i06691229
MFESAVAVPALETEIIRRKRADSIFVRAANLTMSLSFESPPSPRGDVLLSAQRVADSEELARKILLSRTNTWHHSPDWHRTPALTIGTARDFQSPGPRSLLRRPQSMKLTTADTPLLSPSPSKSFASPSKSPAPPQVFYRRLTLFGLEPPEASLMPETPSKPKSEHKKKPSRKSSSRKKRGQLLQE